MAENIFSEGFESDFLQEYLSSAIDGFNFSLENFGINVYINELPKKVLLKDKPFGNEKEVSTLYGDINIGDIVDMKGQKWIAVDMPVENDIYVKAHIKLCNTTFPIKKNTSKIMIGRDKDGRPQYTESYDLIDEPCIATMTYPTGKDNQQLPLPEGIIDITIKFQDADNIKYNQNFEIYGQNYSIINIDYTKKIEDKGIIVIRGMKEVGK